MDLASRKRKTVDEVPMTEVQTEKSSGRNTGKAAEQVTQSPVTKPAVPKPAVTKPTVTDRSRRGTKSKGKPAVNKQAVTEPAVTETAVTEVKQLSKLKIGAPITVKLPRYGCYEGFITKTRKCPDTQEWLYDVVFTDKDTASNLKQGIEKDGQPVKTNTVVVMPN
jgi:hypothetical protein